MDLRTWSKSEVEYGRKVVDSGLDGVRSGREAVLRGEPANQFLCESVRGALKPAVFGACLGVLAGCCRGQRGSAGRTLLFGFLGGAAGLGAGVAWKSRHLTASVLSSAVRNIGRARDEHWLERHPIDYA